MISCQCLHLYKSSKYETHVQFQMCCVRLLVYFVLLSNVVAMGTELVFFYEKSSASDSCLVEMMCAEVSSIV